MMNQKPLCNIFLLLTALLSITSCEIKGDKKKLMGIIQMNKKVAGIYKGTIIEISAHQRLIYLQTTDGQILELTFKSDSFLTDKVKDLPLKKLKKADEIEVTLRKIGDSLEVEKIILLRALK